MKKMNAAQQLYMKLGMLNIWIHDAPRLANYTKAGPGRRHRQGKVK